MRLISCSRVNLSESRGQEERSMRLSVEPVAFWLSAAFGFVALIYLFTSCGGVLWLLARLVNEPQPRRCILDPLRWMRRFLCQSQRLIQPTTNERHPSTPHEVLGHTIAQCNRR